MSRLLHLAGVAGGALGVALAVPVVEFHLLRRIPKAPVPGPHPLDGIVDGWRTGLPLRCMWLGDSLSSGVGAADAGESLPHQTARLVASASGRPVALTVLAVPSATVADVLALQLPVVTAQIEAGAVDVVIVAVGANDVAHLTVPWEFKASYRRLIAALGAVEVVCVGVPDMGAAALLAQPLRAVAGIASQWADRCIQAEAGRSNARYVDIANRPPSTSRRWASEFLAADRYHPNAAGYALWAAQVAGVLTATRSLEPGA